MHKVTTIVFALAIITSIVIASVAYLYLSQPAPAIALSASGATFPAPLLNTIIKSYHDQKSNVQITYDPTGSSSGIAAFEARTVDFACSDAPLSASDSAKAPNALHIPETIGAVTISYHLEGISKGLNLTGLLLSDIFAGKITKWNDPAIQTLNTFALPNQNITVVHRSDGSGTTYIFTSYLSKSSDTWANTVGAGKTVEWPAGLGANGNTGVASVVQANPFTIGYIELAYALQNNMTIAAIQNPSNNWITPSLDSIQKAAESASSSGLPASDGDWSKVSLLNAQDPNAYPIVSFSYTLVYKELNVISTMNADRATAIVDFLWWMVHDGQELAPGLSYAHLPSNVIKADEAAIRSITYNGQIVFKQ
jgi:phosphate transport system substrate-binding protein